MGQLRNNGVLFSLDSLLEAERQRIVDETEAERKRLATIELARADRARHERQGELEHTAELANHDRVERREREQSELAAKHAADVERARREGEARVHREVLALRYDDQWRRELGREQARRRRAERLSVVLGLLTTVSALGAMYIHFAKLEPEAKRAASYQAALAAHQLRADEYRTATERAERKSAELAARLDRAERELRSLREAREREAEPR